MVAFDLKSIVVTLLGIYLCYGSPSIPPDPVKEIDFPDPCATYYNGTFYAFGGNHGMSSKDLTIWTSTYPYLEGLPSSQADLPFLVLELTF